VVSHARETARLCLAGPTDRDDFDAIPLPAWTEGLEEVLAEID
jgi:hypothetical protein